MEIKLELTPTEVNILQGLCSREGSYQNGYQNVCQKVRKQIQEQISKEEK